MDDTGQIEIDLELLVICDFQYTQHCLSIVNVLSITNLHGYCTVRYISL